LSTITIIGEGAWGTAVSTLLAENGHTVLLWCHDPEVKKAIENTGKNERYLPGISLSEKIIPVINLNEALEQSSWIFEAIPIKFLRSVLTAIDPSLCTKKPWVILSKGIEKETLLFPSQIVDTLICQELPKIVLFGPSFAQELAQKQVTAVTLATEDKNVGLTAQQLLANFYFRPYLSCDVMGVQIGGALKNVIALAVGMLTGAGYSDNTRTFIITRGLHEMVELAQACGGKKETLYGLSGVGDLILTSLGKLSRNTAVGQKLGQGQNLQTILQETGAIPEGINTLESVQQMIVQKKLKLPILSGIYDVIFKKLPLQNFLNNLMNQPLEYECYE
jgi:glycerol-3-phosphate dehydrogenase (NAD(P)+)